MLRLALATLLAFCSFAHAQPFVYDTAPAVVEAALDRSLYFTQKGNGGIPLTREQFLERAERDRPTVVHLHGCAGIHADDRGLGAFFLLQGANVILMDFLARGVGRSCDNRPRLEGHPETSNPARIEARRLEMERQVAWLQQNDFTRVFVSGHSEGGRVVQGLKAEVRGVFIEGMDCKNTRFWSPSGKNRIQVFLSRKDPWLGYPAAPVRGCSHFLNSSRVSDHWTDIPLHGPQADDAWSAVMTEALAR